MNRGKKIQTKTTQIRRTQGRKTLMALGLLATFGLTGCATVQPWQKDTLAIEAMAAADKPCHRFEHNNEVYREGAVGANGGKGGGGCGCT
jgi:hypothetical protein